MQILRLLTSLLSGQASICGDTPAGAAPCSTSTASYAVPWRVMSRQPAEWVDIGNISAERLSFVRFAVAGEGELALSLPCHVAPGETVRLFVDRIPVASTHAMITVEWRRPSAEQYLWLLCP